MSLRCRSFNSCYNMLVNIWSNGVVVILFAYHYIQLGIRLRIWLRNTINKSLGTVRFDSLQWRFNMEIHKGSEFFVMHWTLLYTMWKYIAPLSLIAYDKFYDKNEDQLATAAKRISLSMFRHLKKTKKKKKESWKNISPSILPFNGFQMLQKCVIRSQL